jgi:hypothetical protein
MTLKDPRLPLSDQNWTTVVVPVGALGAGVRGDLLDQALAAGADAIALDAGSTDSGPAYLATGKSKYSRDSLKSDLTLLMVARDKWNVPLLIGSCGTSGCDEALDATRDIALEIAAELGLTPRICVLYSEMDPGLLKARNAEGRIHPLAPFGALADETLEACEHIVALMGPEPYIAALEAGADIVLGGRTTDTAVIAAVPLMRGAGAGPAWHAGKIAECGGQCTVNPIDGGVVIKVGADRFDIAPMSDANACTPFTVSEHMLYENSDPHTLYEPGGVLHVEGVMYEALDHRRVTAVGSRFEPAPYTMKLEGATNGPFQTIMIVGIAAPEVMASVDVFLERMQAALDERTRRVLGLKPEDYTISLRPYGWNAVTGSAVSDGFTPRELGLMLVATAATQDLATRIAKTANPYFFHFPLTMGMELPSYAFPFSPAEIERGRSYEFLLNHVVEAADGHELVRTAWIDLSIAGEEPRHGQA